MALSNRHKICVICLAILCITGVLRRVGRIDGKIIIIIIYTARVYKSNNNSEQDSKQMCNMSYVHMSQVSILDLSPTTSLHGIIFRSTFSRAAICMLVCSKNVLGGF